VCTHAAPISPVVVSHTTDAGRRSTRLSGVVTAFQGLGSQRVHPSRESVSAPTLRHSKNPSCFGSACVARLRAFKPFKRFVGVATLSWAGCTDSHHTSYDTTQKWITTLVDFLKVTAHSLPHSTCLKELERGNQAGVWECCDTLVNTRVPVWLSRKGPKGVSAATSFPPAPLCV
jgi:hypothetical protein